LRPFANIQVFNTMAKQISPSINLDDTALPMIMQLIERAAGRVELLDPAPNSAKLLETLRITSRSPMGALVQFSGGLLVNDGIVRVLGSGHARLPRDLASWNAAHKGFLLVADDAFGGFFAINTGALGPDARNLYYWPAKTLAWQPLEFGYTDFVYWLMSSSLASFYAEAGHSIDQRSTTHIDADRCVIAATPRWLRTQKDTASGVRELSTVEFLGKKLAAAKQAGALSP
jgi:hypothetical protein